jgi:hypothetical protein
MTDLVAGRYPISEEEWLLDGQPLPPYRRTISRRDIVASAAFIPTVTTLNVYAVPVQQGDVFNYVSFLVKTVGGTLTHSWVAVYNGVTTGAALLAQVADNTTATGWAATAQKLQLAAAVSDVGQPGTPQGASGGPGSWATTAAAPAIWGIAFYQAGTTGNTVDGMSSSAVAGAVAVTSQVPFYSTGTLAATGTAPAVLPTMAAAVGGIPYLLLSRQ